MASPPAKVKGEEDYESDLLKAQHNSNHIRDVSPWKTFITSCTRLSNQAVLYTVQQMIEKRWNPEKSPFWGDLSWTFVNALQRLDIVEKHYSVLHSVAGIIDGALYHGFGIHATARKSEKEFVDAYAQLIRVFGNDSFYSRLTKRAPKAPWTVDFDCLMHSQQHALGKRLFEKLVRDASCTFIDEYFEAEFKKLEGTPTRNANFDKILDGGLELAKKYDIVQIINSKRIAHKTAQLFLAAVCFTPLCKST